MQNIHVGSEKKKKIIVLFSSPHKQTWREFLDSPLVLDQQTKSSHIRSLGGMMYTTLPLFLELFFKADKVVIHKIQLRYERP